MHGALTATAPAPRTGGMPPAMGLTLEAAAAGTRAAILETGVRAVRMLTHGCGAPVLVDGIYSPAAGLVRTVALRCGRCGAYEGGR